MASMAVLPPREETKPTSGGLPDKETGHDARSCPCRERWGLPAVDESLGIAFQLHSNLLWQAVMLDLVENLPNAIRARCLSPAED
jgi:hypothetical protein